MRDDGYDYVQERTDPPYYSDPDAIWFYIILALVVVAAICFSGSAFIQ